MAFSMKRNDRLPSLTATLKQVVPPATTPTAIDLTGVSSVTFRFRLADPSTSTVTSRTCVIVSAAAGQVRVDWDVGDTTTAGRYLGEFEILYPSGKLLTVPNDGYEAFEIIADLA